MSEMKAINFKLDSETKNSLEEVCSELGMTMTTAFTLFAKKVARERRIPFELSLDPFYSQKNQQYLEEKMRQYQSGKLQVVEPELFNED